MIMESLQKDLQKELKKFHDWFDNLLKQSNMST
jgi:hypothetical protein